MPDPVSDVAVLGDIFGAGTLRRASRGQDLRSVRRSLRMPLYPLPALISVPARSVSVVPRARSPIPR